MDLFLAVLKNSIIEILYLTGLLMLAGFILGLFERISNDFMQRAFGRKGIFITAWLGTPIHEMGHAIMCLIFNHRIKKIKLLDTRAENGVLGYVNHSYNSGSIYQGIGNLFIALGPIFSGIASLILGLYFLLPKSFTVFRGYLESGINGDKIDANSLKSIFNVSGTLVKSIFASNNLSSFGFWFFLIIAVCVSSHIALSKADIKGAQSGFIVLFVIIFAANYVLRYFSVNTEHYVIKLSKYNAHLMAFLLIALIFSAFTLVMSCLCYTLFSKNRSNL